MIYRASFAVEDYRRIPFRREEAHFEALYEEAILPMLRLSTGFTWWDEDRPVVCAGLFVLWPGVAEAWFHMSDDMGLGSAWRDVIRDVRKMFYRVCQELKLRRVQTKASLDFPKAHALIQFLGLWPEVVLKKFGPRGEDTMQYVRLAGAPR